MVEIPSHEMRIVSSGTLVSMFYPEGVPSPKTVMISHEDSGTQS